MIGALTEVLTVGGEDYPIRTDYRNILQVFEAFQDPDLQPEEKWIVAIYLLFEDFSCDDDVLQAAQNGFDLEEAIKQISWFISAGQPEKQVLEQPTYNWTQDEQMIFSAINKVAGRETRELEYLHWWTFLGYFNEVGEGTFSFIVGIRNKLNKGKKLEKHEKEFLSHNKELVLMKKPLTKEEQEQEDAYKSLLDEVLG
ncbi:Gp15 family bacteriophage protein [Bacteroides acidifaciens]|uniref:Gp15 family bacteriophage protein n=1 Tax=Bacteroides acidifaciens TaxID=85831 RepID=UPI00242C08DA|nr:Gp15 family bacteriophage protein [Bacteroides acidifaciens]